MDKGQYSGLFSTDNDIWLAGHKDRFLSEFILFVNILSLSLSLCVCVCVCVCGAHYQDLLYSPVAAG